MKNASSESFATIKRNIALEIDRIDRKIDYITTLKDEALTKLMEQKRSCTEQEELGEAERIDEEIALVRSRHEEVLTRQSKIHHASIEYEKLEQTLADINNEIMAIQERHDNVIQQLTEKREFLQERLESIQRMDNMQVAMEEEIMNELKVYESELTRLHSQRKDLLRRTDMSPSEMEAAMEMIDTEMEVLESKHALSRNKLNQAYNSLQEEFSQSLSPARKMEILKELEKLKQQSINATPSELIVIEKRIEQLNKELEQLQTLLDIQEEASKERLTEALQERGLHLTPSGNVVTSSGQVMSMDEAKAQGHLEGFDEEYSKKREQEHLTKILEERGLKMTPSGRIQLESGEVISMEEARKQGLLQGLEEQLMKSRGITLTASGHIQTREGKLLSRSQAEHLGLLDGINLDEQYSMGSETETVSSTTATSMSGMSSADVHYLKTVLGRPLALALAEITAKQPRDPIHYLGHWLYKYRYNQEVDEVKKKELAELLAERERVANEAMREQAENEAKDVMVDLLGRVDKQAQREKIEKELQRIEEEALALEAEEAELASEARDTLGVYNGPTKGQQLH